jgi:hypothetical protein
MSKIAEFSSYVGLVVLLSAVVLLSPRLTVAAWAGLTGWLRLRWLDVVTWRPRTVRAEPCTVPVDVRIGARFHGHHAEVLEPAAPEGARQAVRRLWWLSREALEVGAVVLAVVAVLLRSAGQLVDLLPEPAVLAGDLLLVLATFLVMERIIRHYPAELLPSVRFPRRAHPGRVRALPVRRTAGRLDHAVELVGLAVGLLVVLAWPSQLGMYVGELRFGSTQGGVLVGWAFELPWLLTVGAFLVRDKGLRHASTAATTLAGGITNSVTNSVTSGVAGAATGRLVSLPVRASSDIRAERPAA